MTADDTENGRRLASEREDLITAGVDPAELLIPLAPADDTEPQRVEVEPGYRYPVTVVDGFAAELVKHMADETHDPACCYALRMDPRSFAQLLLDAGYGLAARDADLSAEVERQAKEVKRLRIGMEGAQGNTRRMREALVAERDQLRADLARRDEVVAKVREVLERIRSQYTGLANLRRMVNSALAALSTADADAGDQP